jgi:hypothetical protein
MGGEWKRTGEGRNGRAGRGARESPDFATRPGRRRRSESGRILAWGLTLALAAVVGAILLAGSAPRLRPRLRDEHSQPAVRAASGMVAVAADSKTFHVPGCPYLHGPWKLMPAEQAIREGYSPCVRCEKKLLGR